MTSMDVGSLFRPIIEDIITLVDGQLTKVREKGQSVNGIILVGGFGQSECLLKCLRGKFSQPGRKIEVMQPVNAWTAVVRGAVLRGLEGTELVLNRKARRNYGTVCTVPFISGVHSKAHKYWDNHDQAWVVDYCMTWYIKKGETVSSTDPVLFSFYITSSDPSSMHTSEHELILCDADRAPLTYDSRPRSATRLACKMIVNLQLVPTYLWTGRRNSNGTSYKRLDFEKGMQVESAGLRFEFRVGGVVYGKVMARFD